MTKLEEISKEKELFKQQILEGMTNIQLGKYWKCSNTTISTVKNKLGFTGLSPYKKATIIDKDLLKQQILEGYTKEQLAKYWKCSPGYITKNKKKYGLLNISPNVGNLVIKGKKKCGICGEEKDIASFQKNGLLKNNVPKYAAHCKSCMSIRARKNKINIISEILKEEGLNRDFKCEICGYNKNYAALCFHHLTNEKNFGLGEILQYNKEEIAYELSICSILCFNCHQEIHNPSHAADHIVKNKNER